MIAVSYHGSWSTRRDSPRKRETRPREKREEEERNRLSCALFLLICRSILTQMKFSLPSSNETASCAGYRHDQSTFKSCYCALLLLMLYTPTRWGWESIWGKVYCTESCLSDVPITSWVRKLLCMRDVCVVINFVVKKAATLAGLRGKACFFFLFLLILKKQLQIQNVIQKTRQTFLTNFDSEILDDYYRYHQQFMWW